MPAPRLEQASREKFETFLCFFSVCAVHNADGGGIGVLPDEPEGGSGAALAPPICAVSVIGTF